MLPWKMLGLPQNYHTRLSMLAFVYTDGLKRKPKRKLPLVERFGKQH
jgi:hypothetical protein